MFKHLTRRPATACLAMGERVLPKLWVDPRLNGAATALQAGQDRLEAKWRSYESAAEAARGAVARREQAHRNLEDRLREFALNVLSTVRNNHASDTYIRYFPVGYGNALRERPEQIREMTRVILGHLEQEPDPWLVTFQSRIDGALATFVAAQDLGDAAVGDRRDAFAYLVAERRSWVQALSVSRLEAKIAYLDDEAYVRGIYSPAAVRRRAAAAPSAESEGLAATTSRPEATDLLATLRLLPASAATLVRPPAVNPAKAPAALLMGLIRSPSPRDAGYAPTAHQSAPARTLWSRTGGGLRRILSGAGRRSGAAELSVTRQQLMRDLRA